jgi:peptidoglycan/LPS O-acetylase OafA/YrhL
MSQLLFPETPATIPLPVPRASAPGTRFHGLDWLRAVAALLVVVLHAGMAYTLAPFPGLAWPVHDAHPSPLVDAITWWIDGFVMPTFFLLGGFVAAQLLAKRGTVVFLNHRVKRLLLPFVFGCVVILPMSLYIWLLGWVVEGRVPLVKLRSLKLDPDVANGLWGVAHLWFLEYLFLFSAVAAGWIWVRQRAREQRMGRAPSPPAPLPTGERGENGADRVSPRVHCSRGGGDRMRLGETMLQFCFPFLFAIPSAVALFWQPRVVIGFDHAWHPLPANLLYYAPCFGGGWWLWRRQKRGLPIMRWAEWHLGLSLLLFVALLPQIRAHCVHEFEGSRRAVLANLFAVFAWLSSVGWFGVCLKHLGRPPRLIGYLSEASFWVYLFHHPMVGLTQVALAGSALPAAAKYVVVIGAAVSLSLLTYHALVRNTWVGALLNGRRAVEQRPAGDGREVVRFPEEREPLRKTG